MLENIILPKPSTTQLLDEFIRIMKSGSKNMCIGRNQSNPNAAIFFTALLYMFYYAVVACATWSILTKGEKKIVASKFWIKYDEWKIAEYSRDISLKIYDAITKGRDTV